MLWQRLDMDSIPEIRASQPHARDTIVISDIGGLAKAFRDLRPGYADRRIKHLEKGDLSLVAPSDEFMADMERHIILTKDHDVRSNVTGGVPNVPAYLAGHPLAMRERYCTRKPNAPLAIFFELTGSSGIDGETRTKRNAALLALARTLHNVRPVELYACIIVTRIETSPMDLGRAAAVFGHSDNLSGLGHSVLSDMVRNDPYGSAGSWAYGIPELERKYSGKQFSRILQPGSEILHIPAMYLSDVSAQDSAKWLRHMMVKYGGDCVEHDASETVVADIGMVEPAS